MNLINRQLGDYKLIERFASGGMAEIYRGVDTKLGRKAAIKVLSQELLESDELLTERFKREARAVANLEHENIIPIYQYGEEDDLYFLAMKFIEGEDLADEMNRLQRQGELMDVGRMLKMLRQVAAALDFAHTAGIIHRDVKPSNILIDQNGKAILSDFGLVLRQQVDKTMGTAFGTPRYISPEQALASERAVPQSDIYSLAVIAYEILTGSMVFKADTAMQIALSHISEKPTPPSEINPDIPKAVEREILKALEKKPEKRHKTATEFVEALADAYGTLPEKSPANKTRPEKAINDTPVVKPLERPQLGAPPVMEDNPTMPYSMEDERPKPATVIESAIAEDAPDEPPASKPKKRSPLRALLLLMLIVAVGGGGFLVMNANNTASAETSTPAAVVADPTESEPTRTALPVGDEDNATLVYMLDALVLRNDHDQPLDIRDLVIERADGSNRFEGESITLQTLDPGNCVVITLNNRQVALPDGADCTSTARTIRQPMQDFFWRNLGDVAAFVVQIGSETVRECPTIGLFGETQRCAIPLPVSEA